MNTNKVLIIAEAGVNHNGSIKLAKKLIDGASSAGADIIKFQTFNADKIVTKTAPKAKYQLNKTSKKETQFEMLKKLQLSEKDHVVIKNYCKKKKIEFLSTPFDIDSFILLKKIGIKRIKISSGDITNLPLLRSIAKINIPTILSTGMSSIKEIRDALNILINNGLSKKNITILHCTTSYPTNFVDVNLNAMITIKKKFKVDIGYSDHTQGIEVPIAATALGAKIIEKHITLNKAMDGPDHAASLNINEFSEMVRAIRNIEISFGDGKKNIAKSELKNIKIVRKSIHILKDISKGELFSEKNLIVKRPSDGISPMKWDRIINKKAKKNYKKDTKLT